MVFCAVFTIVENFKGVGFIVVGAVSGLRGDKYVVIIIRDSGRILGVVQKVFRENLIKESIGLRIIL